mgnify:CR=1 FL=1
MAANRVRKRDGREAPFDARKIEAAVAKALAAVGEEDAGFAREIAGVVELTLENRYPANVGAGAAQAAPDIEEIQDLVEQALIELGRANVAKAYILYRDRRSRAREALAVHASSSAAPSRARVEVRTPERSLAWSKGRIVAALINEGQLPRETAERVASSVEERVFAAGLKRISTALVRELVDNELMALGLSAALRRQVSYGLPAYDLRALLAAQPAPLDPAHAASGEQLGERRADTRLGGEVLRRFALDEVLSADSASAHLSGELHVTGLEAPHLPLTIGVPAALLVRGDPTPLAAFELLEELVELAHETAFGIVLEDAQALLAPLCPPGRSSSQASGAATLLAAWLRALAAASDASGRRIDLSLGALGARGSALGERLVRELADPALGACAPRLFLDHGDLHAWLADTQQDASFAHAAEQALLAGRLTPTWGDGLRRCVGPGLLRSGGERSAIACAGAVAINLPRIALRAGPWREERALELLSAACQAAIRALEELGQFQQRIRTGRIGALRAQPHFALVPVGLREMLAYLGDGEVRPEQGARVLGFFNDAARRYGEPRKLSVDVDPHFGERAAARFAKLDAELPQHAQRLLFGDGVGAGIDPRASYSAGWRLSPVPGHAPWACEAIALRTLGASSLHPLPEERSRGGIVATPESWRRFDRLRERADGEDAEHAGRGLEESEFDGREIESRAGGQRLPRADAAHARRPEAAPLSAASATDAPGLFSGAESTAPDSTPADSAAPSSAPSTGRTPRSTRAARGAQGL